MARTFLKAPWNTASHALVGNLGWDTIECTHNRFKVNYYARLHNMDPHRWPKLLHNPNTFRCFFREIGAEQRNGSPGF